MKSNDAKNVSGLLLMALLIGCGARKEMQAPYQQPAPGQHPTLEVLFGCKASNAKITVSSWYHWTSKERPPEAVEAELRDEIRNFVVISEAERDYLSSHVSLLGYSGSGTMELKDGVRLKWKHLSAFMDVDFVPPAGRNASLTLHLAPQGWLKILKETERK